MRLPEVQAALRARASAIRMLGYQETPDSLADALERAIRAIPGVIDTGLFLGTADTVLVADGETIRELVRRKSP